MIKLKKQYIKLNKSKIIFQLGTKIKGLNNKNINFYLISITKYVILMI